MPRLIGPEFEPVYRAAEEFREAALRTDGSLFTPGRPIWSRPILDDLHARIFGQSDGSARSFEAKLRDQLHDANPETIQLAAEMLFVHLLVARDLLAETKRNLILGVLGWSPQPVGIPNELDGAFAAGIATAGTAFLARRPDQLRFLIETLQDWKDLPEEERGALIVDPWRFRQFLFKRPIRFAHSQREALLHLVFPDTFEAITSKDAKQRIAERFREHVPDAEDDVDRQLAAIRRALEPRFGAGFRFYAPQVKPTWQPDDSPWGQFVHWADRFASWPGFDAAERSQKLTIAERMARVRDAVRTGDEQWRQLLKEALGPPNTFGSWGEQSSLFRWCAAEPQTAQTALGLLWEPATPLEQRIQEFMKRVPEGVLKQQAVFVSLFLAADATEYPIFRQTILERGFKLTQYPERRFPPDGDAATWYSQGLGFLDTVLEEAGQRGLELRDRLDAESVLACVTRWKATEEPVASWSGGDRRAFLRFRGEVVEPETPTDSEDRAGQGTWIFQSSPRYFDLPGAVATLPEFNWTVRQHEERVKPGDTVYLWESGAQAGIVGVATVLTEPGQHPDHSGAAEFDREYQPGSEQYPQVRLRIERLLPERILRLDLRQHPVLKDLGILRMSMQTNYPLTPEQATAISELLSPTWPGENAPPNERRRTFDDLMQYLEGEGLHFSEELVANYLLALQTKRFVILSGISGTGKTQLALAVARYFQPLARVETPVRVPTGAFEVQVQPYMARYHQWALRTELRAALRIPALEGEGTTGRIEVLYPGGRGDQAVFRDAQNTFYQVSISRGLRVWFDAHLRVGDRFLVEVLPAEDDGPDRLRLSLPDLVAREAPLENYAVVAVRPDWTDHRGLLGFFNPLTARYTVTPFLRLVLDAHTESEKARAAGRAPHPYFAILDEMNLARVEHYFSDFLSALESGEPLDLYQEPAVKTGQDEEGVVVPHRLPIPPNLFFTGTVNIDETTYMFSPKVLDRAFTLELNQVDLSGYRDPATESVEEPSALLALEQFPGHLAFERPPEAEDWERFRELEGRALYDLLLDLHEMLAKEHRHFGYRVANEIARFVTLASEQAGDSAEVRWDALDLAILQKVLPKFHGTQQELEAPLQELFAFAVAGGQSSNGAATNPDAWERSGDRIIPTEAGSTMAATLRLPRTATKVWRMLGRLRRQGFTAFIE